ncbi:hypothetical protein AS850_05010 [Frondihabitans sp. 762G35]|uniref:hypothetical protein n=1 Tax=Frondihabitans sp. 762G35 TaxID=1446794 RepID=UPI000D20E9AC|nr:hypothetical protein [Frondihabitans sp. 762G35]ARC56433.1 hypothetical protein AS850_05010 [Frondihabitans sp. 762G35]
MFTAFTLPDSLSLDDLHTFLGRAATVDDGSTRLVGAGGVLAVYVGVLAPSGILDRAPTVMGLRTYAVADERDFDVVVPIRALLDRVARLRNDIQDPTAPIQILVPPVVTAASWAAITPPRGGWTPEADVDADLLESAAKAGIDEVAATIPAGTGEQIVHRVRSEVWSRPVVGADAVPSGAAFAALALGFLGADDRVRLFSSGPWLRVSTSRGHVLVKQRGGPGSL